MRNMEVDRHAVFATQIQHSVYSRNWHLKNEHDQFRSAQQQQEQRPGKATSSTGTRTYIRQFQNNIEYRLLIFNTLSCCQSACPNP